MNRRRFLQTSSLSLAAPALAQAAGPFERPGSARLQIALAAYSFRRFFTQQRNGKAPDIPEDQQIDMMDFIDFCADHGCIGAELTSYFFDQEIADKDLIAVRRHAFLRGVEVSGTAIGNNFTFPAGPERDEQMAYTKAWIDRAVVMGAPHIRVFAGKHAKGVSEEQAWDHVIENLKVAGDYAGERGIFLGIENHDSVGDYETLLKLVEGVNHPWVGVNLDSGNFRTEDPYLDMQKTAPFAVNVQLKVEMKRAGADEKERTDLAKVMGILKEANYQGYVVLEYEEDDDPYTAIPPLLEELRQLAS